MSGATRSRLLVALLAVMAIGGAGFAVLAALLSSHRYIAGDLGGLELGDDLRGRVGFDVARAVTDAGATPVIVAVVIAVAAVLVARRRPLEAATLIAGTPLTLLAVQLAKYAEGRPRPPHRLVGAGGASFPSGHAGHSISYLAAAIALSLLVSRRAARAALIALGVALAAAIGLSRVYLRVHYLSDVLGGWALAAAIFAACAAVAVAVDGVGHNLRR